MSPGQKQVPRDVLQLLAAGEVTNRTFRLPPGQLDRARYNAVNAVLEALGGQWSRKERAHVFAAGDASERITTAVAFGFYADPKALAFFPTPAALARQLVEAANVLPGHTCLEPSAGDGAIVRELVKACGSPGLVHAVEIDARRATLTSQLLPPGHVTTGDFLLQSPRPFHRVVMNPPFSLAGMGQADVEHVEHAMLFLEPNGVLVAVMAAGIAWRTNARSVRFRERPGVTIEELPPGSFTASGTDVGTVLVTVRGGGWRK